MSTAISREVHAGRLRRIAQKLYTTNFDDPPERIVRRNLYPILARYFPQAVISHRSALEGGLSQDGSIFLTYKHTRRMTLPGVTIRLLQGEGPVEGDTPFMGGLFLASRTRALLENLQPARARSGLAKSWSKAEVEELLDKVARVHGERELNQLRDHARRIAPTLGLEREFQVLNELVGALLGTRVAPLGSAAARARAAGTPYDPACLERCLALFAALKRAVLPARLTPPSHIGGAANLAFFEAYFSNFIEGTEFEVEEAADIVFHGRIVERRPADSHDILGTFRIVSDTTELRRILGIGADLVELLKARHLVLLSGRPEQNPGRFKETANRVGQTVFVAPELVEGTLLKAFESYQALDHPLARAMYLKFLVAEVHPFNDGNGRIARVMMNAELVRAGQVRIIIPTVYRDDYLLALRALTRQGNTDPYLHMLDRAQAFTAQIDFSDYDGALAQLRAANAFLEPDEGQLLD
ncbi:MAG: Fic family protein [Gammaproteobacteria bacterium]